MNLTVKQLRDFLYKCDDDSRVFINLTRDSDSGKTESIGYFDPDGIAAEIHSDGIIHFSITLGTRY